MTSRMMLIGAFAVVLNGLYAGLQVWLLSRHKPWPKWLGVAICLWVALMSGLFLFDLFGWVGSGPILHWWFYLPMTVQMVWNVLLLQFLVFGMIVVTLVVRHLRPVKSSMPPAAEGISRRKFLYLAAYGAAPATALGMGVHGTLSCDDLRTRELLVPIANLPPELEGFTIAHVSDLHSGIFCGPKRLKIISDATNDLKADLIAITGDVVNGGMDEFPAALEAIRRMESRHGVYLSEGNHDVMAGAGEVGRACLKNNLPWLYNSCATIPVRGRRLLMGGLPWLKHGFEGRPEIVSGLYPARQEGDVRILMSHYPHLFDIADSTDLVLSGHTHGGQIMLGPVGIGPVFFKYWSGLYRRAGSSTSLVVSNGCGDWFPCRIGAPAEVALLRLTAAKML